MIQQIPLPIGGEGRVRGSQNKFKLQNENLKSKI